MADALAYVNWGRWIAECLTPGCHDAIALQPGQTSMTCIRGHTSPVRWPANAAAITTALNKRHDESKRNWFPQDHPMAVVGGYPQNQSPAELDQETTSREQAEAAQQTKHGQLVALLQEFGIQVGPDGDLHGRL